jgi:hypothetical protein
MMVHTKEGLMERYLLSVKDIVTETENARVTATEWYRGDDLVRRDVHVNILAPQALGVEQGRL